MTAVTRLPGDFLTATVEAWEALVAITPIYADRGPAERLNEQLGYAQEAVR